MKCDCKVVTEKFDVDEEPIIREREKTPVVVTLTDHEARFAGLVGFERQLVSTLNGLHEQVTTNDPTSGHNWTQNIESAGAECALAKWLDRYWSAGVNTFKAGDVGNIEVRLCMSQNVKLKVAANDPPNRLVVLVTGKMPHYNLEGFIMAKDAQVLEYREDPGNYGKHAYFVPVKMLHDIRELRRLLCDR